MKRGIAALLRHRSAWQLVAIAAVCASLGLLLIYGLYRSRLRQLQVVLVLLFAVAGAALVLAFVRRAEEVGGGAAGWTRFIFAVLGLAGALAFVTFSLGHHRRDMVADCNAARLPDTLAAREQALAGAEAGLRSPFALLPRLLDDEAGRECERSREDLARVAQGLCTRWPIVGLACRCGEVRHPGAHCEAPLCVYEPGAPERFDCPGDPLP